MFLNEKNTRVYNLISVPQIIRLLLEDVIILIKQTPVLVARTRSEAMVKLQIIKRR